MCSGMTVKRKYTRQVGEEIVSKRQQHKDFVAKVPNALPFIEHSMFKDCLQDMLPEGHNVSDELMAEWHTDLEVYLVKCMETAQKLVVGRGGTVVKKKDLVIVNEIAHALPLPVGHELPEGPGLVVDDLKSPRP